MGTIRILIADDHAVFREGLRALLDRQDDMEVVGEAGDGEHAVRLVGELGPDVVIMDLNMPRCGGLEAIGRLREQASPARVIVLSMYDEEAYVRAAITAGACGYVTKALPSGQLLAAVRSVQQRRDRVTVARRDGTLELRERPAPSD